MVKNKDESLSKRLIEHQLKMIGKTYEEAQQTEGWFHEWTFTKEQYDEFYDYAIPLIMKVLRVGKKKADYEFRWFDLAYGLRIKTENNDNLQSVEPQ
jgi:hypothetical protein